MAVNELEVESARANPSSDARAHFRDAHAAWRCAKAEWETHLYTPGNADKADHDEESNRLCGLHEEALDRFMMVPSPDVFGVLWKLKAFRDEEMCGKSNPEMMLGILIDDLEQIRFCGLCQN